MGYWEFALLVVRKQENHSVNVLRHIIQVIAVIALCISFFIAIYFLSINTGYFPPSLLEYVSISVIAVGGYFVIRIFSRLIIRYGEAELPTTQVVAFKNLFQISALVVLAFIILFTLGVNIASALVGAGFIGIVLGLAAQTVLGNIFAGLALLGSKQFKIGDRLTINGQFGFIPQSYMHDNLIPGYTGTVKDIGLTHTIVLGDDNVPISYPNSVLLQSMIFNHSRVQRRTVRVRMDVKNDIPIDQFRDAMDDALGKESLIVKSLPVIINPLIVSEDKYNVAIEAWINGSDEEPGKALLISKAIEVVSDLRRKAGPEIYKSSPIRIGDQVVIRGEFGTVEKITPRTTIVKTWDNRRQVIPNHVLDNEVLINYTLTDKSKLFPVVFNVTYNTDLDQAKAIMIEEARNHSNVLKDIDPVFQVLEFSETAISLRLLFFAKDQGTAFGTGCDLRFSIKKRFDEVGIKLSCQAMFISPESKIDVEHFERKNRCQ
jgi:small-conductance mechanosensitive channel